jgi:small subunit ribosomal protein S1
VSKKKQYDVFADEDAKQGPQNEFEALLNSSRVETRGLRPGDRFRGEVLAVSGKEAFVSTGTPTDAVMPFTGEPPKAGDVIEVLVVRAREGDIVVKAAGSRGVTAEADSLEDAFDMELPVEGTVIEAVKGGFRVKVQGQSAFCPISQIDFRCVNAADYVGKKYEFIITRWEQGRDIVVSRRKMLDQERAANEGEFMQKSSIGEIYTGKIVRLEKYGAFIRLDNGIEGLIPISEMAWGRVGHPADVVALDQHVQVKLIRAEEDGDRLKVSFSLKQGGSTADPWSTIESDFPPGTQIEGTVEHKENFGLFVNIAAGITGLLPRSAWRDATDHKDYESKRRGDKLRVRVERLDMDSRKLSFTLPREDDDETWRAHGSVSGGAKAASFGTLGDLLKGIKGK